MRAFCMIRPALHYRRDSFTLGLRNAGYDVVTALPKPTPEDVLLIWQRYGHYDEQARHFEAHGARVLVAENGYLGKAWKDQEWFALAQGHHAGAGEWRWLDNERWDRLGVELQPWREGGKETIILAQRGIGERGVASPPHWAELTKQRLGVGRIRAHPGNKEPELPLLDDLAKAESIVTWNSSAALRALIAGIPVWCAYSKWIGASAGKPLSQFGTAPMRDDAKRLQMFRRLIWAQFTLPEIRSGFAFKTLLGQRQEVAA